MDWHDDYYGNEIPKLNIGPDDSDGYREYNGLPVALVYRILNVYEKDSNAYWLMRREIMKIECSSVEQLKKIELLVDKFSE